MSNGLKKFDKRDALKAVARGIGKEVAFYIEQMYPEAVKAASSTFLLSIRNCVHNAVMDAIESDEDFVDRLRRQDNFRRQLRKIRKASTIEELKKASRLPL